MITVDICGNGDFVSISQAISSASPHDTIYIKRGIYHERVEIFTSGITLIGESANDTVIEYDLYANKIHNGEKLGTFRSYTFLINADDFVCKNLTIANTSGFGHDVGQAIAVYAEGDNIIFENCLILGHQDTLFTGPLPHKEIIKGDFMGPTEFAERKVGHQIYRRCFISGEVDFVFGSAAAYFEECELFSIDCGSESYVTAASTYIGEPYGYIFNRCRFTGNAPQNTVYIGRPWRNHAQTILTDCQTGAHIHPALFHDWNKKEAHDTIFYGIYNCTSTDGTPLSTNALADYVKILTKDEAQAILDNIKQ